jgi:hypothetical protein
VGIWKDNLMKDGFKDISEYEEYRPKYGSWRLRFDPMQFLPEARATWNSPDAKRSGRNDFNRFNNTSQDTKRWLSAHWNEQLGLDYDWNWEYFHSGEPAGLHTDYLSFPNSWKPNKDVITHDCYLVLGIIIPLEWNCKQPYTVNYDKLSDVPRKMLYRKGEMRYIDNDEVFEYRTERVLDPALAEYNPEHTEYSKEYLDLKLHSVYQWNIGTCMVFDTRRWHSSSWFLSDDRVPKISTEHKRSIIGFASVDVDR